MQSADDCECRYIFIAIGNLGKLALEVVNVGLEAVTFILTERRWWFFFLASRREAY